MTDASDHKILIWSPVERRVVGGVQHVIRRLADHLRTRERNVEVVWTEDADEEAGRVCSLYVRPSSRRPLHLPSLARAVRLLLRVRPSVVNVHFATAGAWYFVLLRPFFRYRLVLSLHGSDLLVPRAQDADYLPTLLAGADRVTVVSDHLLDRARSLAPDGPPIETVPNGVDLHFWSPAPAVAPRDGPLLAVGRLEPVKGFDVLLQAFAEARRNCPAARLEIVGHGTGRADLERLAGELGVADAVVFAGAQDQAAVRERLRRASAFVLPSRSEGMPLSLLEAMACGAPCVATRVGGVEEVLDGHGLTVSPEAPDALAQALVETLERPEAARARAATGMGRVRAFDEAAANARYEALLTGET